MRRAIADPRGGNLPKVASTCPASKRTLIAEQRPDKTWFVHNGKGDVFRPIQGFRTSEEAIREALSCEFF